MADKESSLESKRSQYLWKIGMKYAKRVPELSRFYLNQLHEFKTETNSFDGSANLREICCEVCGSRFDDSSCKVTILKKTKKCPHKTGENRGKTEAISKAKEAESEPAHDSTRIGNLNSSLHQRNKNMVSIKCKVCNNETLCVGTNKLVKMPKKRDKTSNDLVNLSEDSPQYFLTPSLAMSASAKDGMSEDANLKDFLSSTPPTDSCATPLDYEVDDSIVYSMDTAIMENSAEDSMPGSAATPARNLPVSNLQVITDMESTDQYPTSITPHMITTAHIHSRRKTHTLSSVHLPTYSVTNVPHPSTSTHTPTPNTPSQACNSYTVQSDESPLLTTQPCHITHTPITDQAKSPFLPTTPPHHHISLIPPQPPNTTPSTLKPETSESCATPTEYEADDSIANNMDTAIMDESAEDSIPGNAAPPARNLPVSNLQVITDTESTDHHPTSITPDMITTAHIHSRWKTCTHMNLASNQHSPSQPLSQPLSSVHLPACSVAKVNHASTSTHTPAILPTPSYTPPQAYHSYTVKSEESSLLTTQPCHITHTPITTHAMSPLLPTPPPHHRISYITPQPPNTTPSTLKPEICDSTDTSLQGHIKRLEYLQNWKNLDIAVPDLLQLCPMPLNTPPELTPVIRKKMLETAMKLTDVSIEYYTEQIHKLTPPPPSPPSSICPYPQTTPKQSAQNCNIPSLFSVTPIMKPWYRSTLPI